MTATGLSLAGVAVALIIMWANFRPWWKGTRDPKALLPFGAGWLLGALATVCAGGALGWGAAGVTGLLSKGGNTAVSSLIGTGPAALASTRMGTLTPAGGIVVCIILAGVVLLHRASGKLDRRRIIGGIATGAVLGFLPGVAAQLGFLPDAANYIGAWGAALGTKGAA
ncbi:hypothetical protein B1H20_16900 [Streptomyces violaceoruber]|uniref:Uncharacterized protein n=1 Tax=Streptomyces violaceoruber TaxID=1935 RepID=A0A1V0UCT5_STRVN|nr:hypothetical protein [Streptomyces violaceoruber]ARF62880.1 hypothetical protein B1H20_16900 [Streptomyces violaceoruber]